MLTRRTLLVTLAALPLCGWMKPKAKSGLPTLGKPRRFSFHTEVVIVSIEYLNSAGELRTFEHEISVLRLNEPEEA